MFSGKCVYPAPLRRRARSLEVSMSYPTVAPTPEDRYDADSNFSKPIPHRPRPQSPESPGQKANERVSGGAGTGTAADEG